jgi:hypothetical protein
MTINDLRKRLEVVDGGNNTPLTKLMTRCKGMSFEEFWNIAPPISNITGRPSARHDFQQEIIEDLDKHKRIAILKCRSAGLSTLALYRALWLVLSKHQQGSYIFITGIGLVLSMLMCRSAKQIISNLTHGQYIDSDNAATITFPNNSRFSFFSSDSKSYRGQGLIGQQVVFVCVDECAWFEDSDNWLAAIDTFAFKSGGNTEMILISTPSNNLHGLTHNLFESGEGSGSDGLYKIMKVSWERIENKMLSSEQLNILRQTSKSWRAEYCLVWGAYFSTGTVYNSAAVDNAISLGAHYNPDYFELSIGSTITMGVDPGLGSSGSGLTILQLPKDSTIAEVLYCDELLGSSYENLIELCRQLIDTYNPSVIWIDAANPEVTTSIKKIVGDELPWRQHIERIKSMKPVQEFHTQMKVVPIAFNSNGKQMLEFAKFAVEKGEVAIHPSFTKLIGALRTAVENNGLLNKKATSFDNAHDSFLLSLKAFDL